MKLILSVYDLHAQVTGSKVEVGALLIHGSELKVVPIYFSFFSHK